MSIGGSITGGDTQSVQARDWPNILVFVSFVCTIQHNFDQLYMKTKGIVCNFLGPAILISHDNT